MGIENIYKLEVAEKILRSTRGERLQYCRKCNKNVTIMSTPDIPGVFFCEKGVSTEYPCMEFKCIYHKAIAAPMSVFIMKYADPCAREMEYYYGRVMIDIPDSVNYCEEPKSGCFIATAAYGTPYNKEINVLRKFRDNNMLSNDFGKWIVHVYYKCSPPIATIISKSPKLRAIVRFLLRPIILIVKYLNKLGM